MAANWRRVTLMAVTIRIRSWMTTCSIRTGQGTATRKNKTGKAKCRNQERPPIRYRNESEMVTTTSASAQPNNRQSGFASARNRIGRKSAAQESIKAIPKVVGPDGTGVGRLRQRFQNR